MAPPAKKKKDDGPQSSAAQFVFPSVGDELGVILKAASFQGPLPPPSLLREYEEICPGAANEMLARAKQQMDFRQEMQRMEVDAAVEDQRADRREARLGQIFGLLIGVTAILSGSTVAIYGSPVSGATISGLGIVSLVSAFIIGRTQVLKSGVRPEPQKVSDAESSDQTAARKKTTAKQTGQPRK